MSVESNVPYVANLVNSIIGVSVLAMPFCMKKCGLVLGLSLLLGAAWLTYISCSMLVSAAAQKRRRTYEYLALYTVGTAGKFAVELSMIGLMLGTCVAFYVVIGDLATGILAGYVDSEIHKLRTFVIVFCALCIALPLGLMKNLAALGRIGVFSLVFYMLFVFVMLFNSINSGMLEFGWIEKVELFRPAGVFQCLPIFSLAYACQCQLFVVYDSLEDPSIVRMDKIVTGSLKIVTTVYCLVAVFGYATFTDEVQGNVLQNFKSSIVLELIKLGFAVSVVVGFPLMIFPCRQSIHTLFFRQQPTDGTPSKSYIEPFTFKAITLCIVLSTMSIAILIPNVETILGLTGATMGSFICFIFPAIIFSKASPKGDTTISKFVFGIGCLLLIVCTYSNVFIASESNNIAVKQAVVIVEKPNDLEPLLQDNPAYEDSKNHEEKVILSPTKPPIAEVVNNEHRHEPANPMEPVLVEEEDSLEAQKEEEFPEEKESLEENKDVVENEPASEDAGNMGNVLKQPEVEKDGLVEEKEPVFKEELLEGENKNIVEEPIGNSDIKVESPVLDKKDTKENVKEQLELDDKIENKVKEPSADEKKMADIASKNEGDELKNQELLDKIKEQHKKQHELLQEQEQLIQALEEQQEKMTDIEPQDNIDEPIPHVISVLPENDQNLPQNVVQKSVVSNNDDEQKIVAPEKNSVSQDQEPVLGHIKKVEPIPNDQIRDEEPQHLIEKNEKNLEPDGPKDDLVEVVENKDVRKEIKKNQENVENLNLNNHIEVQQQNDENKLENVDNSKVINTVLHQGSKDEIETDLKNVDHNIEEIVNGIDKKPRARDLKSVLLEETVVL